jgi:1,4-dihydroxy-2-naphthoate octaprenyltransferase
MLKSPVVYRVRAFIRLGRFQFLAGGFVLHGLGVAAALYAGAGLNIPALLWGQIAISAVQLMTHYTNDYFDLEADRANHTPTRWSGGSRVLTDGDLAPRIALLAACVLLVVAVTAALHLALVVRPGGVTLVLLSLSILLAWGYSAPPLRLHSRGLGELTTAVLVTGLTPLIGYYLQSGRLDILPILVAAPLCVLQFAMLLAIEFPDEAGDRVSGKDTLVVRLGASRAARLYVVSLLTAYGLLPLLVLAGLPLPVVIAVAVGLPLAIWQGWRMVRREWANPVRWNSLAMWSVVLLMGTAAAQLIAFIGLARGIF